MILFEHLVDLRGFEPLTSSVRLKRAPNCATGPISKCKVFYFRQRGMSSRRDEIHLYILYIALSSAVHARVLKWTYQSDTNVSLLLLQEFDDANTSSNSYFKARPLVLQVVKRPLMDVPLAFSDTGKQKFVFLTLPAAARIIIETSGVVSD